MKRFVETIVRRPVTAFMLVSAILLLGGVSVQKLPVGLLPNLASPGITVITRWPGVAADKIDETLTVPSERQVSDIPGMEKLQSVSSEGESRIHLIFSHNVNIKAKIIEAAERISMIRSSFPREVDEPYIVQYDPTDKPVFIVSFAGDAYDLRSLRELIDRTVKLKFERIEGVSEVFVSGGYEREIQVTVDPARLGAHSIASGLVTQAVAEGNVFLPGGRAGHAQEKNVYTDAKLRSIDEIHDLLLSGSQGRLVRLSQIARISDGFRERDNIAKTNGEERVTIYVEKAGNANTLRITDECARITAALSLPGVRVHTSLNQGEKIRKAVSRVVEACITGGVVVMFVLYAFLGRPLQTFVIALSLPVSVFATFFLMFLSGIEINVMTLSGLALGSGMLLDNSIVVSESIQSCAEKPGMSPFDAVTKGTLAVFAEISAATFCSLVVFVPLLFTDPETQRLYSGLSATVTYSLLVSLFTSLSITPAFLHAVMIRRGVGSAKARDRSLTIFQFLRIGVGPIARRYASGRVGSLVIWCTRHVRREASVARISQRFRISVRSIFDRPRAVLITVGVMVLLLPFVFGSMKKEYFDPADSGDVEASVDLETGTDIKRTETIVVGIEAQIRKSPFVEEVSTKIEKWHAALNVHLSERGKKAGQETVIKALKQDTRQFSDAFVYFAGGEEGGGREFDIDFYGDDLPELKRFAGDLSTTLRSEMPGVEEAVLRFREPKGEILIEPSRISLARAGTTVAELGTTVRNFLSGAVIGKFYDTDREIDIRFRASSSAFDTPEKLESMILPFQDKSVPVRSVASFREGKAETKIHRRNKRKSVTITLHLGSISMDEAAGQVEKIFSRIDFPKDTIYDFGDEYKRLRASQREMTAAVAVSILILFMVLAALFESVKKPILILIPIPLTIAGIIFFLGALRMSLNMGAYIGMIMLGGIATNNSILLVSTIFRRMETIQAAGPALIRHVLQAASTRIRPILMTTITTALGMAPMIFDFGEGSAMWRPLAITAAAGLIFSLVVTLVLVPFAAYHYLRLIHRSKEFTNEC